MIIEVVRKLGTCYVFCFGSGISNKFAVRVYSTINKANLILKLFLMPLRLIHIFWLFWQYNFASALLYLIFLCPSKESMPKKEKEEKNKNITLKSGLFFACITYKKCFNNLII